jgi:hypothetical protein
MSQISSTTKDRVVVSSPHSRYQELSGHVEFLLTIMPSTSNHRYDNF